MQNRGIGIGSSPIGNEGFSHPSARPRRSKIKLVLQYITKKIGYSTSRDLRLDTAKICKTTGYEVGKQHEATVSAINTIEHH